MLWKLSVLVVTLAAGLLLIKGLYTESLMYTQWRNMHGAYYTVVQEDADTVTLLTGVATLVVTKEHLKTLFTRVEDVGEVV